MAFCTKCGTKLGDVAQFCPGCGQMVGTSTSAAVALSAPPLEYTIQGDNLQVARVKLKPGQELYAEAGKMLYKTANVHWETRMSGESLGDKIWGA